MKDFHCFAGRLLAALYLFHIWQAEGAQVPSHARRSLPDRNHETIAVPKRPSERFLQELPKKSNLTFYPAQCEVRDEWFPYQRVWNGDPNSELPYKFPKIDIPMQCSDHDKVSPRMLVVANGANLTVTDWLKNSDVPYDAYHAAGEAVKHKHNNSGKEAEAYLRYIVEHYDCLADVTLFAHSHNDQSWHRRERLDSVLRRIRWHKVKGFRPMSPEGYHTKLYLADPIQNFLGREQHPPYEPYMMQCGSVFNGSVYPGDAILDYVHSSWVLRWWDLFLGRAGLGPAPETITFSVGAEFLVTKERIQARPRQFYVDSLSTMMDFERKDIFNAYFNGVVWENIWQVVFGEEHAGNSNLLPDCELYDCSMEPGRD